MKIITASYSADLAAKHAGDCRAVMQARWYQDLFPQTRISPAKNQESNYETTARGYRYATSVGGTLTGLGADVLIIDDLMKASDARSPTCSTCQPRSQSTPRSNSSSFVASAFSSATPERFFVFMVDT